MTFGEFRKLQLPEYIGDGVYIAGDNGPVSGIWLICHDERPDDEQVLQQIYLEPSVFNALIEWQRRRESL